MPAKVYNLFRFYQELNCRNYNTIWIHIIMVIRLIGNTFRKHKTTILSIVKNMLSSSKTL